jgi:hypothetical protein
VEILRHVEIVSEMERGRMKENDGRVEFNYDIFVISFVNVTIYLNNSTTII